MKIFFMNIYYLCPISQKLFETRHIVILYFIPHTSMCIKQVLKHLSKEEYMNVNVDLKKKCFT